MTQVTAASAKPVIHPKPKPKPQKNDIQEQPKVRPPRVRPGPPIVEHDDKIKDKANKLRVSKPDKQDVRIQYTSHKNSENALQKKGGEQNTTTLSFPQDTFEVYNGITSFSSKDPVTDKPINSISIEGPKDVNYIFNSHGPLDVQISSSFPSKPSTLNFASLGAGNQTLSLVDTRFAGQSPRLDGGPGNSDQLTLAQGNYDVTPKKDGHAIVTDRDGNPAYVEDFEKIELLETAHTRGGQSLPCEKNISTMSVTTHTYDQELKIWNTSSSQQQWNSCRSNGWTVPLPEVYAQEAISKVR